MPAEYRKTIEIKEHTFTKTLRKMCLLLLPRLTRCRLHLQGQNGIEYSGYQLPLHLPLWPSSPSFSLVYSPKGNNPLSPTATLLHHFPCFNSNCTIILSLKWTKMKTKDTPQVRHLSLPTRHLRKKLILYISLATITQIHCSVGTS